MEDDVAPHRSRLPALGGPSRIPGPPPRRDGPLGSPAAPTKRSCLSVTLCRAGGGSGGPPWERLRGPAPVTPVPPRPRPVAAEGLHRRGGPGGAEAAPAVKMGVPCSPPRSGGSLLLGWGWAGQGGGRHQGVPLWWHHGARCGAGPLGVAGGRGGGWGLAPPGVVSPWPTPGAQVGEGRWEVSPWHGGPGTRWGNRRLRAPCQELLWALGCLSVCLSICPEVLLDRSAWPG